MAESLGRAPISSLSYAKIHVRDAYRICLYTSACPNRCARPCSKNPDKASKDRPKTLKFEQYSGLPRMHKSPKNLVNKGPRGSCMFTGYMRIVGTGRQAILLKLIDAHPKPCTDALRFY